MFEGHHMPHDHRPLGEPAQVSGGDDVAVLDLLVFHCGEDRQGEGRQGDPLRVPTPEKGIGWTW